MLATPWAESLSEIFDLGLIQRLEPLTTGLIHQTWRVETHKGTFIAQRLHPIFDQRVTLDAQAVSAYLQPHGFPIPQFLQTLAGDLHANLAGASWRVMTCLPGVAYRTAPHPTYLWAAGQAAGKFHRLLADWDYQVQYQLPHFHDTAYIWQHLEQYANHRDIAQEADFLLTIVPSLFLPPDLPKRLIHGDLKLTNFLFMEPQQVSGLVDLDTLMTHSLCVEMGDAFRSWCSVGEHFDPVAFEAGLRGYALTGQLTAAEVHYLLPGVKLITLELGMRYLIDVIEDQYFQWDASQYPSRAAHNLARARRQIAVYQDLVRQQPALLDLVASAYSSPSCSPVTQIR